MKGKYYRLGLGLIFLLSIFGCGGDSPPDGTITINPSSLTITCAGGTATWYTHPFTITVTDKDGNSVKDADISIFYSWAVPNLSVVQLYDGNTAMNSPMSVTTDDLGIYYLRFDYQACGGLEYSGDLEVRSGAVYGSAEFKVEAETVTEE